MARACSICTHPSATEIDKELIGETPNRRIAAHFSVSESALRRHKAEHLSRLLSENLQPLAEAKRDAHETRSFDLFAEFIRQLERVNKLSDAVDRWLQDPDDSTRYSIEPRAEDVYVIYREPMGELVRV